MDFWPQIAGWVALFTAWVGAAWYGNRLLAPDQRRKALVLEAVLAGLFLFVLGWLRFGRG